MEHLQALALPGVVDLTPGIRSLQIHFDGRVLPHGAPACHPGRTPRTACPPSTTWKSRPASSTCRCPGTIEATHAVIRKYMQSVRADAPWCPSNIEFIRRINGLDSIEDVHRHRVRRRATW